MARKTYCIHFPRVYTTEAKAIYSTQWGITSASMWENLLDEIHAAIDDEFTLQIFSQKQLTLLGFSASDSTANVVRSAIYTMMADARVVEMPDPLDSVNEFTEVVTAEMYLPLSDIYPIQSYKLLMFESMAPLASALSEMPPKDRLYIQFVCRPIPDTATLHAKLASERSWERIKGPFIAKYWFKHEVLKKRSERVSEKLKCNLYRVSFRLAAMRQVGDPDEPNPTERTKRTIEQTRQELTHHLQTLSKVYSIFNFIDENQIRMRALRHGTSYLRPFVNHSLIRPMRLSSREFATLWHPPELGNIPSTAQVLAKAGGPPQNLPTDPRDPEISFFGHTNFRENQVPFGIKRSDRRRHMYIVGKSGVGKSCLLQLLIRHDIEHGFGAAVLDPHGDLVDDILRSIPKHRVKDVVIFDPTDTNFPPSFNPLADVPVQFRMRVTQGLLEVFRKAYGAIWNDQMGHLLRHAILALLATPGTTLLSLRRMFLDDEFRRLVLEGLSDQAVRGFWVGEFQARRKEFQESAISPFLSRLGQVLASDILRNILGQPLNRFNFRELMDKRKIILMKLSKGIIGTDNAVLLGSIIVSRIFEASMSRADVRAEQRQDFYFYVDEFQNFASESFAEILSESRKYGLNVTMANQFLGQLPENIRRTLFGNVGNLLSFGVSSEDGAILAQEYQPKFSVEDCINLGARDFYLKMTINGNIQDTFSGRTLSMTYPPVTDNQSEQCRAHSRKEYSLPLSQVQELLTLWEEGREPLKGIS